MCDISLIRHTYVVLLSLKAVCIVLVPYPILTLLCPTLDALPDVVNLNSILWFSMESIVNCSTKFER